MASAADGLLPSAPSVGAAAHRQHFPSGGNDDAAAAKLHLFQSPSPLPRRPRLELAHPRLCHPRPWRRRLGALLADADGRCKPDSRTLIAAIKACIALAAEDPADEPRALEIGMFLHSRAQRTRLDVRDRIVANVLIDMYAKCGSLLDASRVFFRMDDPDVVSWTCLILGHAERGDGKAGLELFQSMVSEGRARVDSRAIVAAAKSCTKISAREEKQKLGGRAAKIKSMERGFALHSLVAKIDRLLERDTFVATSLCDMYANSGSMDDAAAVFSKIARRDTVSWNAMLLGYAENGHGRRAVELFSAMVSEGFKPNDRTFVAAFKACSSMATEEEPRELDDGKLVKVEALEAGMSIHAFGARSRDDIFVTTSLLDMYTKCYAMIDARRVFDKMPVHAIVTWNSLLLGYAESGDTEMALELLEKMIAVEKITPDARTFGAALKACGGGASLQLGKSLHAAICRSGALENDASLAGCLVDFYSRCGSIEQACQIFDSIERNDTVTWSSLLGGLSRQGSVDRVLDYFQSMIDEAVEPDGVTFLSVISSCGHAGLVDRGIGYFHAMSSIFGIRPWLEHYHCVIDLLGRANRIDEAIAIVESMPVRPTGLTWTTLLSACCRWKNLAAAEMAFESLLEEREKVVEVGYVLMANLYGSLGMWQARKEVYDALARVKNIDPGQEATRFSRQIHCESKHE